MSKCYNYIENIIMNAIKIKRAYKAPKTQVLFLRSPLNLLVSVSAEAGFDDWEEGEEL